MFKINIPTTLDPDKEISASAVRNMNNRELITLVEYHVDPLVRHLLQRLETLEDLEADALQRIRREDQNHALYKSCTDI